MPSSLGVNVYPIAPPTVNGTEFTVDYYANSPRVVRDSIQQFLEGDFFLSDLLYSAAGAAPSGAVVYNEVLTPDDQYLIGDLEMVAPGGTFPLVGVTAPGIQVATTGKYGAKMKITREAKSRNNIDLYRSDTVAMVNTTKRKSDLRAMAPINAAIAASKTLTAAAAVPWAPAADIVTDLENGRYALTKTVLARTAGYSRASIVMSNDVENKIRTNTKLQTALFNMRDGARAQANAQDGSLDGLLGFSKIRTNPFLAAGTLWMFIEGVIGGEATEYPLQFESWDDQSEQSTYNQLSKSDVYFCRRPKALLTFTNI